MSKQTENLSGYVVDIICLRLYPQNELLERAKVHTRKCSLAGHCTESGFGLVDEEGRMSLLDPNATPQLLDVIGVCIATEKFWSVRSGIGIS